jgi:hypothetical protein
MAMGAYADVTSGDLTNATAIGAGTLVDASNKVRIGNTEVTSIGGEVGWTSFSDERVKDNIKENVPGLEFIKALRPVTYHFNVAKENALLGRISAKDLTVPQLKEMKLRGAKGFQTHAADIVSQKIKNVTVERSYEIEKQQFTGFLAQDVDKAAQSIGYDFSGLDKSGKIMGLRYSDFVVPLVKAVQELSQKNEELNKKNEDLEKRLQRLEALSLDGVGNVRQSSSTYLEQNAPNPFGNSTIIRYHVSANASNPKLIITDMKGALIKTVSLMGNGHGQVILDSGSLATGSYVYSLWVNNKQADFKQMVITR